VTAEPRWIPEAVKDLQNGYDWYNKRKPGLGRQLAVDLYKTVDQALQNPLMPRKYKHPKLPAEPWIRKIQLRRFDEYGLFYTVFNGTFWIVAVAHAKRKPGYWIDRLDHLG